MKLIISCICLIFTALFVNANGDNNIDLKIKDNKKLGEWKTVEPSYSSWSNLDNNYICKNWIPNNKDLIKPGKYQQVSNDCKIKQSRKIQNKEFNEALSEYRNVGSEFIEYRLLNNQTNIRNYIVSFKI